MAKERLTFLEDNCKYYALKKEVESSFGLFEIVQHLGQVEDELQLLRQQVSLLRQVAKDKFKEGQK